MLSVLGEEVVVGTITGRGVGSLTDRCLTYVPDDVGALLLAIAEAVELLADLHPVQLGDPRALTRHLVTVDAVTAWR